MKALISSAMLLVAAVAATPANAALILVSPPAPTATSCAGFSISGGTTCAGGFTGNLNSGSSATGVALTALQALGYTGSGAYTESLTGLVAGGTINFANPLVGINYVGIHYGGAGDNGGQATAFFRIDGGLSGIDFLTFSRNGAGGANNNGLSNAVLLAGPGAVPEPGTWAMMLIGFGGIGLTMRHRRRRILPALA